MNRPNWIQGAISDEEASSLMNLLITLQPKNILEIGIASGWSSSIILNTLNKIHSNEEGAFQHIAIDILEYCYWDQRIPLGKVIMEMGIDKTNFRLFPKTNVFDLTRILKNNICLDLVMIDANHKHPYPCIDLLVSLDFMKPKSCVVLHDINLPHINHNFPSYGVNYLFYGLASTVYKYEFASVSRRSNMGVIFIQNELEIFEMKKNLIKIIKEHPFEVELEGKYLNLVKETILSVD